MYDAIVIGARCAGSSSRRRTSAGSWGRQDQGGLHSGSLERLSAMPLNLAFDPHLCRTVAGAVVSITASPIIVAVPRAIHSVIDKPFLVRFFIGLSFISVL
jgi:hypothetical protein